MTDGNGSFEDRDSSWPAHGVATRLETEPKREPAPRRAAASIGFLLDATRRRRSGRIALWAIVVALFISGVGLLMFPVLTDAYAGRLQGGLKKQFAALGADTNQTAVLEGSPLTRLVIPRLGLDVVVVQGTGASALRAGAGHYVNSALPGQPTGNVAIAGHRTGYGHPFRHLEKMRAGDLIKLVTPFGTYTYRTLGPFDAHPNPWAVSPLEWNVVAPTARPSLTLTTCDPPHQAIRRLVLRAELVGSPGA